MQALLSPDSFQEEKEGGGPAEEGEGRWARPCGVISTYSTLPLSLFQGLSRAVHSTKILGTSASPTQATAARLAFFSKTENHLEEAS